MKPIFAQVLVVASGLVASTAAIASIPDANGTIHGCYNPTIGSVRVIDAATQKCGFWEKALTWNESGQPGAPGAQGPAGPAGQSVVGQSVAPGDPSCPNGGAKFSLGGMTTYACNGAPGAPGPMGPQGVVGPQGPAGPAGAAGTPGPAGPAGTQGAQGPAGPMGPAGPAGAVGATGPAAPDPRFGNNPYPFYGGPTQTGCILGQIWLFAGEVGGGVPAEGQLLPINQNTALFSLLGTMYGGDGQQTFALPDLRNAAPNGLRYAICTQGIFPSRN